MSNKSIISDAQMSQLPGALRRRMDILGHTQEQVTELTGVAQPQISRALHGRRKRLTPDMEKLCRYAELRSWDLDRKADLSELEALLRRLTSADPTAAACIRDVLTSLAPLIERHRDAMDAIRN